MLELAGEEIAAEGGEAALEVQPSAFEGADLPDDSGNWSDAPEPPDDSGEWDKKAELPDDSGAWGKETYDSIVKENDQKDVQERMEVPVKIVFKCPDYLDLNEFTRQVKNQEKGLNNQTISENMENRKNYIANGRDVSEGDPAQKRVRQEAYQDRIAENQRNGMSYSEARAEADEWIKNQAALHDPDQIAGGNPQNVTGVGDKRVNSSIGAQWKEKVKELDEALKNYIEDKGLTAEDCKRIKLNVILEVKS